MENLTITDILDLGFTGGLMLATIVLWRRVGELTNLLIERRLRQDEMEDRRSETKKIVSGDSNQPRP